MAPRTATAGTCARRECPAPSTPVGPSSSPPGGARPQPLRRRRRRRRSRQAEVQTRHPRPQGGGNGGATCARGASTAARTDDALAAGEKSRPKHGGAARGACAGVPSRRRGVRRGRGGGRRRPRAAAFGPRRARLAATWGVAVTPPTQHSRGANTRRGCGLGAGSPRGGASGVPPPMPTRPRQGCGPHGGRPRTPSTHAARQLTRGAHAQRGTCRAAAWPPGCARPPHAPGPYSRPSWSANHRRMILVQRVRRGCVTMLSQHENGGRVAPPAMSSRLGRQLYGDSTRPCLAVCAGVLLRRRGFSGGTSSVRTGNPSTTHLDGKPIPAFRPGHLMEINGATRWVEHSEVSNGSVR